MNTPATPTATAARARTGDKLALPARGGALPARLLHGMGGVEYDGRADFGEDRQRPHVRHQRVVAEADAALGNEHIGPTRALELGDDMFHVPWREELALLDIDRAARSCGGDEQIGLAAEKGRDSG